MLVHLTRRGPLLFLLHKHQPQHCLALFGILLNQRIIRLFPQDHREHLLVRIPMEGHLTGQHEVEDDPGRPDVRLLGVLLVDDLGGDVAGGAYPFGQRLGWRELAGNAEIDDLQDVRALRL